MNVRLVLMLALAFVSGCSMFASEEDRAISKLTLNKLKSITPDTVTKNGAPQGFRGIVVNESRRRSYNVSIVGPEERSYFMFPGQRVEDWLIAGRYSCSIVEVANPRNNSSHVFHSRLQKSFYGDAQYHWWVTMGSGF